MRKIRKGDEVIVLTGRGQGKRGSVLRVLVDDRVVVEGVNIAKRHTKPNPAANVTGGIIDKEMPIAISNLALFNPTTKKGDRVGFKVLQDGRKVRVFKSNNEVVDT